VTIGGAAVPQCPIVRAATVEDVLGMDWLNNTGKYWNAENNRKTPN